MLDMKTTTNRPIGSLNGNGHCAQMFAVDGGIRIDIDGAFVLVANLAAAYAWFDTLPRAAR